MRITRRQLRKIIREAIDPKEVNRNSLEVDFDPTDYPDYSDASFSYGEYTDGTEMTPDELDQLSDEDAGLLYDTVQEFI